MTAQPPAEPLGPESFGSFAPEILEAFEALFGVPFEQAGRWRQLLQNPPRFQSVAEREATELVRRAYRLGDEVRALLDSGRLRNEEWQYLLRLSADLRARVCFEDAQGRAPAAPRCELPLFALRTECESEYLVAERRRIVLLVANAFPDFWQSLPAKARPKSEAELGRADGASLRPAATERGRFLRGATSNARNRLLRGIAAALILGGWISEERTRTKRKGAGRFRKIVQTVTKDLAVLAEHELPVEGEEDQRPKPLLPPLPGETEPRQGVLGTNSRVLRMPDLKPSFETIAVDAHGRPWGVDTRAESEPSSAPDLRTKRSPAPARQRLPDRKRQRSR